MKYSLLYFIPAALFMLIAELAHATSPAITSFSPVSGIAGSSLTIGGSGFNTTPANNFVFFGTVQGTVISATANSLTVTVPDAAGYNYISVTNLATGLTAYSGLQFITGN